MDIATLFVAFGSAILGSAVGFIGARLLHDEDIKAQRRGAVRAVYYEVRRNAAALKTTLDEGRVPMPLERSSYDACLVQLATFLTPVELETVTRAYIQHDNVARIIRVVDRRGPGAIDSDAHELMAIMLGHQRDARDVLLDRGFTGREQAAIVADAKEPAG